MYTIIKIYTNFELIKCLKIYYSPIHFIKNKIFVNRNHLKEDNLLIFKNEIIL